MRIQSLLIFVLVVGQTSCNNGEKYPDEYIKVNDTQIIHKRYYEDGTLKAMLERNNDVLRQGKSIYYYQNGNKRLEINIENGVREGVAIEYHDNGQLKSKGHFANDNKVGTWSWYYPNGSIELVANYKDGKQDGYEKGYHVNGNIQYIGKYSSGVQDSTWTWYKEDGSIDQIEVWDNGKCVLTK